MLYGLGNSVEGANLTLVASGERTGTFGAINSIIDGGSTSALLLGFDQAANTAYAQPPSYHSGLTCAANDNAWHNMMFVQKASSTSLYVDSGTACASTSTSSAGSPLPARLAGNEGNGFNFLTGYFGDVIYLGGGIGGQLSGTVLNSIAADGAAYW